MSDDAQKLQPAVPAVRSKKTLLILLGVACVLIAGAAFYLTFTLTAQSDLAPLALRLRENLLLIRGQRAGSWWWVWGTA